MALQQVGKSSTTPARLCCTGTWQSVIGSCLAESGRQGRKHRSRTGSISPLDAACVKSRQKDEMSSLAALGGSCTR